MSKSETTARAIPVAFRENGGVCFVVEPDAVRLLRLTSGMADTDIVPELGVMTREHAVRVAMDLLEAITHG